MKNQLYVFFLLFPCGFNLSNTQNKQYATYKFKNYYAFKANNFIKKIKIIISVFSLAQHNFKTHQLGINILNLGHKPVYYLNQLILERE